MRDEAVDAPGPAAEGGLPTADLPPWSYDGLVSEPYRAPREPRSPDPYLAAWEQYRERRAMKWILFFAWPFVSGLVIHAMRFHSDDGPLVAVAVAGLAGFAAMAFVGVFSCPRCGARMYVRTSARDAKHDGCRACGLDVGTPKFPPEP